MCIWESVLDIVGCVIDSLLVVWVIVFLVMMVLKIINKFKLCGCMVVFGVYCG